ncbi:MAG TPA: hypothetical protein VHV31_09035 [Nitrolancea sp.]|nr:hypothetical protein [Nitrolancea sp.]
MRAHSLSASEVVAQHRVGWIAAEDIRTSAGRRIIRKGAIFDDEALELLATAADRPIHVVEPAEDDVHEDEAGLRVARAVAGDGVRIKGPAQSRYHLIAERKGVLRIDQELILGLNRIDGMAVFTLLDRQAVLPGKIIAGVKVTPLTVPRINVEQAEELVARNGGSALRVVAFEPKRVAVIATEGLSEKLRERFERSIQQKIRWYGSTVSEIRFVAAEVSAVVAAMRDLLPGNDILLIAGGNTIDPLDPAFLALDETEGRMVHFGAPSHPGSMFWLAEIGDVPIFNLASCSMYSMSTFADLVLPLVMTGERVTEDEIDEFGYGGLLEREMRFRFPPYDQELSDEENE